MFFGKKFMRRLSASGARQKNREKNAPEWEISEKCRLQTG
jgi:hypothetical protein